MAQGDWVTTSDIRREVPDAVYDALVTLEKHGARIRRAGHKFNVYCYGEGCLGWTSVGGTLPRPERSARQLLRYFAVCPNHPGTVRKN